MASRITAWLSGLAPMAIWRDIIAFLACALTVVCLSGGLVYWVWAPWLQVALIAGALVALIASSILSAAAVAAVATAMGLWFGPVQSSFFPPNPSARIQLGVLAVLVAGGAAAGLGYLVRRLPVAARPMTWLAVALIVINLWVTTFAIDAQPTFNPMTQTVVPSMNEQLNGNVPPDYENSDHLLFMRVYKAVRDGKPYYQSFRKYFIEWGGTTPSSVLNVRTPLTSWLWASLPGPKAVVVAFLALASAVMFSVLLLVSGNVKLPLAIPAVAALGAYFLYFPRQLPLFTTEIWAVMIAALALSAYAVSVRAKHWQVAVVVSVILGCLSFLIRETLAFVPVAGVASALLIPGDQRRFRSISWIAGSIVTVIAYGAHYSFARSIVDKASSYSQFKAGSFGWMADGVVYATDHLGRVGWLAFTLAILGLLGAALIPDLRLRVFALVSTVGPLVTFIFVGNSAVDDRFGATLNYWGVAVVPLLYVCIPIAFILLPGAASRSVVVSKPAAAAVAPKKGRRSKK